MKLVIGSIIRHYQTQHLFRVLAPKAIDLTSGERFVVYESINHGTQIVESFNTFHNNILTPYGVIEKFRLVDSDPNRKIY